MFDFPTGVESLDAVPEPYRALYAAGEGGYRLDADLARRLDVSGLTSALDKERKAAREAERQLKAWTALGRDPDELAALLAAQDEALARDAERKGEWDRLKAQLAGRHQAELAERDAALTRMRAGLERQLVDAAATAEVAAQKGAAALLLPHLRGRLTLAEDEAGAFVVRVVDAAGAVRVDAHGQPLSVKDLVAELRQSEAFARAFDGAGTSGGGMPPNAASGGTPGVFHLTREQARDPAAYRRARDAAGRAGQTLAIVE